MGFDDGETRLGLWPRLSAVCQDAAHLGYEAARWLTRQLSGVNQGRLAAELPSCFEVNQSTGAPPQEAKRILPDGTRLTVSL